MAREDAISDRLLHGSVVFSEMLSARTDRSDTIRSDYKVGVNFRAVFEAETDSIVKIAQTLQRLSQVCDAWWYHRNQGRWKHGPPNAVRLLSRRQNYRLR